MPSPIPSSSMTQFIFTSLISHLYNVLLCDLERQALLRETRELAKVRRSLSRTCPLGWHNQPITLSRVLLPPGHFPSSSHAARSNSRHRGHSSGNTRFGDSEATGHLKNTATAPLLNLQRTQTPPAHSLMARHRIL